jgi:hypothetical protein
MNNKQSKIAPLFNIIRSRNDLNTVETIDGVRVHRQESVYVDSDAYRGMVKCAPYDNHFIFIDPMWTKIPGRWFAMCTCGSAAVMVGGKAYGHLGSPEGMMLVCYNHTSFNKHMDGSS